MSGIFIAAGIGLIIYFIIRIFKPKKEEFDLNFEGANKLNLEDENGNE